MKQNITPYSTPEELFKAAAEGTLPRGFILTLDNDSVYGYAPEDPEVWDAYLNDPNASGADEPEQVKVTQFDLHPSDFLAHALDLLKVPYQDA